MKKLYYLTLFIALMACNIKKSDNKMIDQSGLTNAAVKSHVFLDCMYKDAYFPKFLVDKCRNILLELCRNIEAQKPGDLQAFYRLTHDATERLNDLENEFLEHGSEIESAARDCLATDFEFVSKAYGFEADVEEMIAPRNW